MVATLFFTFPVFAAQALLLKDLQLPPLIAVKTFYYTVQPSVEWASEPGFLKFRVHSPHADYEAEGLVPLKKLLKEIEVIEKIRQNDAGSGFFDGITDSLSSTGEGFVRLVGHPVESVKGVGKAAGKLAGKVGGIFRSKEEGEKTTFSEKMLGGQERELAEKFGVDVYTSNPYMKELLRRMAKARMGGKGAAMIGKILLPVAGLVSVTLTVSGVNGAADRLVNDKGRGDLYHLNQEALLALSFGPEEVAAFLNHPLYTPRETTYVRFYLEKLKEVPGHRDIFKKAKDAKSPWDAKKILYAAQMAADRMKEKEPYQKLECKDEGIAATQSGKIILFIPYDYLETSGLGSAVLNAGASEIVAAGKLSQPFVSAAFIKGIKISDRILLKT
ncbi:MAG: hypothetical protein HYZ83_03365 [Candidatus Omnitrophica bacterium]|nr:hypothetical protein [Candidatus Omnitrophota bacterium]